MYLLVKSKIRILNELLKKTNDLVTQELIKAELESLNNFSLTPVITIVLNFNRTAWNGPKSLTEMVEENNKFKKWMRDYSIYVFNMCNLSSEDISHLSGDFAEIAKVFSYKSDLFKLDTKLVHPLDVLDFLIAYRNSSIYNESRNKIALLEKKGEIITMGTLVDELERNAIINTAKKSHEKGRSSSVIIEFLADGLNISMEEAAKIYSTEVLLSSVIQ